LLGRRGRATLAGPEEYPMRPNPRLVASLLALVALGLAAPACAQPSAPAPAARADPVALSADMRTLNDAVQALNTQGYGALAKHAPALRAIYDRTPPAARAGSPEAQVYGGSALLLAMLANELKRYGEAAPLGERGLQWLPTDPRLTTETAIAYGGLKRPADALRVLEAWLARTPQADAITRARVLRAKGFALVELNRLDEAQAAYEDSLKLEPAHQGARNELTYIAGLRRGKAPTGTVSTTYDKAKRGDDGGARTP
jgi:tetratricopeptide (TPR) repeat protein